MDCNVIKDLLPLYVDECCSVESANLVAQHLKSCESCRRGYEQMQRTNHTNSEALPAAIPRRVCDWKASLLQSVMLFASFAVIVLGVVLEGNTPVGDTNGLWAVALIVPATGYLLSLASWFFLRVYKSRRAFSWGCRIATLAMTAAGYGWAWLHYKGGIALSSPLVWCGVALSAVLCVLAGVLSNRYALLLGKE